MSDSYPTIQETLSPMQREFLGCVEMHLDPPEELSDDYEVESLWRCEPSEAELPGEVVRFRLTVRNMADEDSTERCHEIEFLDDAAGAPVARIRHRMKRVETWHGRFFWTESQFQVQAPDIPDERASYRAVDREVKPFLDRLKVLDRDRALQEV